MKIDTIEGELKLDAEKALEDTRELADLMGEMTPQVVIRGASGCTCPLVEIENTELCVDAVSRADVVEVVRCRDCISYNDIRHFCKAHKTTMFENNFCSYGERRSKDVREDVYE